MAKKKASSTDKWWERMSEQQIEELARLFAHADQLWLAASLTAEHSSGRLTSYARRAPLKNATSKKRTSKKATFKKRTSKKATSKLLGIKWYDSDYQQVDAENMSKNDLVRRLTSPFGFNRLRSRHGGFEWDPRSGALYRMKPVSSGGDDPHGYKSRKIGTYSTARAAGEAALKFQEKMYK